MRRGSQASPRTSTSEWVPLTTSTAITPVVATSDAHQNYRLQDQFTQPGASTTPLLSDQDDLGERSQTFDDGPTARQGMYPPLAPVAAAYPYDAGGSTSYNPSPFNRFIRSKPARNTALMAFLLVLLTSLLHATQPELVDHGYKVLSNAIYRNMGWKEKQEMMSLDARLRELLDRPALEQWEFEPLCRPYFYHDGKDSEWQAIGREDIRRYRNSMVSHLKDVEASGDHLVWTQDYLRDHGGSVKRGIILTGGEGDNIPLIDPAVHFDSVEYKEGGSVFWPDLYKDHRQVVFDKRGNNGLNLAVLHLANHMITSPDMYGFLGYGDKDLFRYSFYALGLPYQQAPKIFATTGGYQTQNGDDMIQWGTTPWSKRHDPNYHPEPAFLHTILAKHRRGLQPDKLFSHLRRPRIDNISEPSLVRTPYDFTGDCFALTLKGPDGLASAENSMRDGQGVLTETVEGAMGGLDNPTYVALRDLAQTFVDINKDEH
ncbi:hypothetical protein QFC22_003839 [Naganishia vaughanmartiniae]|uniref:Uncharacterized protein n=1 Tax=Naganishia vaughanmartiniae TaxID=1424756 RepID=A0ACC2X5J7_9TREE|nr:hypothetical protein QFC22_003839 [Naganishia vaughanmartiniae]